MAVEGAKPTAPPKKTALYSMVERAHFSLVLRRTLKPLLLLLIMLFSQSMTILSSQPFKTWRAITSLFMRLAHVLIGPYGKK